MAQPEQIDDQPEATPAEDNLPEGTTLHTLSEDDDEGDGQEGRDNLDKRGRRSWAREAKNKIADYETQMSEMREKLARLEGQASAPRPVYQQPPQQQQPQVDPVEQHVAMLEQHMDAQLAAIQNAPQGTPQAQLDQFRANYRQLERERYKVIAQSAVPQQQQQQAGPSAEVVLLRTQFPQIFADDSLRLEAQAESLRLMKQRNQPFSYQIAVEANNRILQKHGIGAKPPAPTNADKAKLAGTPGRAGASSSGGNTVALDKGQRAIALATFNDTPYANKPDDWKIDYWIKNYYRK